ncbi:MAG: hypothetical protein SPL63_01690 [Roseburia faecis]|nr:hypothetical protein [Roseburia faecis]
MSNYPFEIVSLVRKKTFSVEARFSEPENSHPLEIMGSKFSRFVFTIISDGKAVSANIPIELLPDMRSRADYAMARQMTIENHQGTQGNSPAFTTQFRFGALAGKTPAQVLSEDPDGRNKLAGQYNLLQQQLAKYPANQQLMDAITDAFNQDPASLKAKNIQPFSASLLNIGCRPLVRKKRPDGFCPCYEVSACWNSTKTYPVTVTIQRYYAPVITTNTGTLNVQVARKERATAETEQFSMSASDWLYVVRQMEASRNLFEMLHAKEAFNNAVKMDMAARQSYQPQPVPEQHPEELPIMEPQAEAVLPPAEADSELDFAI